MSRFFFITIDNTFTAVELYFFFFFPLKLKCVRGVFLANERQNRSKSHAGKFKFDYRRLFFVLPIFSFFFFRWTKWKTMKYFPITWIQNEKEKETKFVWMCLWLKHKYSRVQKWVCVWECSCLLMSCLIRNVTYNNVFIVWAGRSSLLEGALETYWVA